MAQTQYDLKCILAADLSAVYKLVISADREEFTIQVKRSIVAFCSNVLS